MSEPVSGANPYQPPKATLSEVPSGEQEPGSRWARLGAAMLDGIFGALVVYTPLIVVGAPAVLLRTMRTGQPPDLGGPVMGAFALSGLLLVGWCIFVGVMVARHGQTPGKRIAGVKVVRKDGSKAGLGRIFWLRNVVNALPGLIPLVGGLYGLVDILFIFSDSRRCIHDMIADTKVVKA